MQTGAPKSRKWSGKIEHINEKKKSREHEIMEGSSKTAAFVRSVSAPTYRELDERWVFLPLCHAVAQR